MGEFQSEVERERFVRRVGHYIEGYIDDEFEDAERAFLDASVAVWREIDAAMERGPYQGIEVTERGVELRRIERDAWERYKRAIAGSET